MAFESVAQATAQAKAAGFSGLGLLVAVAIAQAESGLNTLAQNTTGNTAGVDRGIMQINSAYHPEVTNAQAYNPAQAFKAAYTISKGGTDWHEWSTFGSGAYKKYMPTGSSGSSSSGGGPTVFSSGLDAGGAALGAVGSMLGGANPLAGLSGLPNAVQNAGINAAKWIAPHLLFVGGAAIVLIFLLKELETEAVPKP